MYWKKRELVGNAGWSKSGYLDKEEELMEDREEKVGRIFEAGTGAGCVTPEKEKRRKTKTCFKIH